MKKLIKDLIPPFLLRHYHNRKFPWKGDYKTWEDAEKECTGYDSEEIAQTSLASAMLVSKGLFPYERDSVLFDEISYSWPLSTALLYAAQNSKHLTVLDFGGGMGSSYFQNKLFTDAIHDFKWFIVEQRQVVNLSSPLSSERLIFRESISDVLQISKVNFVLFSSVLQYLSDPYTVIDEVIGLYPEIIFFDRLLVVEAERDIITKQTVDDSIYKASYPCRFLNEQKLLKKFEGKYTLISRFESFIKNDGFVAQGYKVREQGLFLKRIS